ncbi:MAG TPA: ribbon-helix-helix protein, CopG family [Myxococcota bacterium]|nr:ribbon-helix-helix protein, CopG family [Myxococcota bacterium]
MRTTLTLDDDVAQQLERARRRLGRSLKQLVNEALRVGLTHLESPRAPRKRRSTKAVSLGRCLRENVDDIAEALAIADGERFR